MRQSTKDHRQVGEFNVKPVCRSASPQLMFAFWSVVPSPCPRKSRWGHRGELLVSFISLPVCLSLSLSLSLCLPLRLSLSLSLSLALSVPLSLSLSLSFFLGYLSLSLSFFLGYLSNVRFMRSEVARQLWRAFFQYLFGELKNSP